jgi:hypothetical protein
MSFTKIFAEIFRDFATAGNPASGAHKPVKADIRVWGAEVENTLQAGGVGNTLLADMAEATIKGRAAAAGTGAPQNLTAAEVNTILGTLSTVAIQVFAGSGTYTPTAGMKRCLVISTGGGGGGGGADSDGSGLTSGGGGGAGATCVEMFDAATIGAGQAVTIGAAGTAGTAAGGTGGNGGDTTFGALHTAGGGTGGTGTGSEPASTIARPGGAGGTGSNGVLNISGGDGANGNIPFDGGASYFAASGGSGGASFWGGGGRGGYVDTATAQAGNAGNAYGSGGGGGANRDQTAGIAGGAGAAGVCLVIEFV